MPNIILLSPSNASPAGKPEKLPDHYSEFLRTEKTYIGWVRQYILYHNKRNPREMGADEINDFLIHLVTKSGQA